MFIKVKYNEGDVIGSCVFIKEIEPKIALKTSVRRALFKCFCGELFSANIHDVKQGGTTSCGCIKRYKIRQSENKHKTHGRYGHSLYSVWSGMMQRCTNPKSKSYINYGGRGIRVEERWKDINNFIEDMYHNYEKGMELDRIDNNGDYSPENCRWTTKKLNLNNKRDNRIIEYNGVKRTLSEWSEYCNIPYKTFVNRINKWTLEEAFETPHPARGSKYYTTRKVISV